MRTRMTAHRLVRKKRRVFAKPLCTTFSRSERRRIPYSPLPNAPPLRVFSRFLRRVTGHITHNVAFAWRQGCFNISTWFASKPSVPVC